LKEQRFSSTAALFEVRVMTKASVRIEDVDITTAGQMQNGAE
jgi:hypothetical protein